MNLLQGIIKRTMAKEETPKVEECDALNPDASLTLSWTQHTGCGDVFRELRVTSCDYVLHQIDMPNPHGWFTKFTRTNMRAQSYSAAFASPLAEDEPLYLFIRGLVLMQANRNAEDSDLPEDKRRPRLIVSRGRSRLGEHFTFQGPVLCLANDDFAVPTLSASLPLKG